MKKSTKFWTYIIIILTTLAIGGTTAGIVLNLPKNFNKTSIELPKIPDSKKDQTKFPNLSDSNPNPSDKLKPTPNPSDNQKNNKNPVDSKLEPTTPISPKPNHNEKKEEIKNPPSVVNPSKPVDTSKETLDTSKTNEKFQFSDFSEYEKAYEKYYKIFIHQYIGIPYYVVKIPESLKTYSGPSMDKKALNYFSNYYTPKIPDEVKKAGWTLVPIEFNYVSNKLYPKYPPSTLGNLYTFYYEFVPKEKSSFKYPTKKHFFVNLVFK